MSEQSKQALKTDIGRLEAGTTDDGKTVGRTEKNPIELKFENHGGVEANDFGKVEPPKTENTEIIKLKAKEKLEDEKKKAAQKNFADPIITYLLKRCEEDLGMAEDVAQDGKTWDKCFKYITEQARKLPRSGIGVAVEDHVVYEWAEDYYHKEEKQEPVKKEKNKKSATTKRTDAPTEKSTKKVNPPTEKKLKNETKPQRTKDNVQVPEKPVKKDAASKQRKTEKSSTKSSGLSGQMSLFDLL